MAASANRCFKFHKRSQLFIRSHNEPLSIATMSVNNPECAFLVRRCSFTDRSALFVSQV
jgi:hypothetical protein